MPAHVHATKENCQIIINILATQKGVMKDASYVTIRDFLDAVMSRLPCEESVDRDRERKRAVREAAKAARNNRTPYTVPKVKQERVK